MINPEPDAETLPAIDRGIRDADEGRTVSLDDARKLIPQWISKWSGPTQPPLAEPRP
jgi:hypothetical protein